MIVRTLDVKRDVKNASTLMEKIFARNVIRIIFCGMKNKFA
jgi:hypothetical protein